MPQSSRHPAPVSHYPDDAARNRQQHGQPHGHGDRSHGFLIGEAGRSQLRRTKLAGLRHPLHDVLTSPSVELDGDKPVSADAIRRRPPGRYPGGVPLPVEADQPLARGLGEDGRHLRPAGLGLHLPGAGGTDVTDGGNGEQRRGDQEPDDQADDDRGLQLIHVAAQRAGIANRDPVQSKPSLLLHRRYLRVQAVVPTIRDQPHPAQGR